MIEKSTVLILGAGASKPFGFPLGRELGDYIIDQLTEPSATELGQLLLKCNPNWLPNHLRDFAINLRDSQRNSVDAFLEHRQEFMQVGKAAIVATLMGYERPDAFRDGDWYRYLFNALSTSFESFEENKLAVVTFNYDRSLEFYLCTTLQYAYGQSFEESRSKASAIPIVHLHGKMGNLLQPGDRFRPYEPNVTTSRVLMAAGDIRIIHESTDGEPQFAEAHKHIAGAHVICFLGFGYDPNNIKRLFPSVQILREKTVFGCAFGMTIAERERAQSLLSLYTNFHGGGETQGCLQFLREHHVLS